ncbi:MAG: acetyltransferase-like isoleucine patch superfamily enzyme [Psychroserpens sp.]|jgi:acetyltransferase-like isoleucine patch superfamily enzyme
MKTLATVSAVGPILYKRTHIMKIFLQLLIIFLPQNLRKYILTNLLGYIFKRDSRIGYSIILSKKVTFHNNAVVGHLNFFKGFDEINIGEYSTIGNLNWITAFPKGTTSKHFAHQPERLPVLKLGKHTAITNRHLLDCTGGFFIGDFTTFAGFRSQVLTHSIDLTNCRQNSSPVIIGDYCFIGTNSIFLLGSKVPDRCIIAASSTVTNVLEGQLGLFAGVPAKRIKDLNEKEVKYMTRTSGYTI